MSHIINAIESTKYNTKSNSTDNKSILNRNMFEFNYIIGKGGFGKVWRVRYKKTNEIFALKEMNKKKIIDKKCEKSINNERIFLSKLNHPFLVNMHFAFQDKDNLYLVIDILNGGDLRYHCSRYKQFSEEQTRFFIACLVHALSYIHKNNVIHRDIKPENLVLDDKGYVHITDFGIAKDNFEDNRKENSGTPGYMAPEVMKGFGHSFSVDYFAIGVIGYEFMNGRRPYRGKNRKEIKEQMLSFQAKIKKDEIVKGWSLESRDFINKLLKRKPENRLGSKDGIIELKEHFWLKYYPWDELENKILPGPFIPEKKDNFNKNYCQLIEKITENTRLRYEEIAKSDKYRTAFANFYFNKEENIKNNNLIININFNCLNNNISPLRKDLIGDIYYNINTPMISNRITNAIPKQKLRLKQSNILKVDNINAFYKKYLYINKNPKNKNINEYLYKIIKERPFSTINRIRKGKIKKSWSQPLYNNINIFDNSLFILLNPNSGFITLKHRKNKSKEENKNKIININNCNNITNKNNNSFSVIRFIKKDIQIPNNSIDKKLIEDYNLKDKIKIIEKKSLSEDYLNRQQSARNKSNLIQGECSELFKYKNNIKNKISYKKINKNNISNIIFVDNKKSLFNHNKRNNSFFLKKKNNNNSDLSTIRLYNLKNNSILNSNIKFIK